MKLRNILALIVALCMVFALCACGGSTEVDEEEDEEQEEEVQNKKSDKDEDEEEEEEEEEPKAEVGEYIVYVVDQDDEPVAGVELKFNKDTGDSTVKTDEDGRAKLVCYQTEIVVTVEEVPEGYESDSDEYPFDDEFEITITLDKE